jgi:PAS domain-containing protein
LYVTTLAGEVKRVNSALVQMLGYPDPQAPLATHAQDLYVNLENREQWQMILLILTQLQSVVAYDGAPILTLDGEVLRVCAYRGPLPQAKALAHHFQLKDAQLDHEVVRYRRSVIIADVRDQTPMAGAFAQMAGDQLKTAYSYIRSWIWEVN